MKFFRILFFLVLLPLSASAWERVPVVLNFKSGGELHTSFYCFNDFSEGKKIAEEIFNIKHFDQLAAGEREKVLPVPLGTRVGYYDWAIFCYGDEFWLFENHYGFLYGRGMLLSYPREK